MLGPVLRLELITTARRGRYYLSRVIYGLFLLFAIWTSYQQRTQYYVAANRMMNHREMAQLAQTLFTSLGWLQWIAVLVVVPAMTAGVIADAHRRKILRDLLSSGLSARAIVFGKLAARLVHVASLVALGIPVVALIGLFGGLDPVVVSAVYLGTASIAFAVGGVSILASTLARRPREAIIVAYALEIAWLILPPTMGILLKHMIWPFPWLDPINNLLVETNPFSIVSSMSQYAYFSSNRAMRPWMAGIISQIYWNFAWMVTLQFLLGLVSAGLAAFLIRKLRAGDREGMPARSWADMIKTPRQKRCKSKVVAKQRPEIGEDPMMWKEWYASPHGGLAWLVSGPIALILGVLLACFLYEIGRPAFWEMWDFRQYGAISARTELNQAVRTISMWLMAIWLLTVSSASAVAITSEREDDTWTNLTASLLTGREVVTAKIWGALWSTRSLAFAQLAVVAIGVLCGGVHPLGGLVTLTGIGAFGAFTASLGLWCSLRMTTSTRALVASVVFLVLVNVGLALVFALYHTMINEWPREESPWIVILSIPFLEWIGLFSSADLQALTLGQKTASGFDLKASGHQLIFILIAGQALYALGAFVLWATSCRIYERVAGRAFRTPATAAVQLAQGVSR